MSDNSAIGLAVEFNGAPASGALMGALQQVEVGCSDSVPSTFSLTFHDERQRGNDDFPLLQNPSLQPFTRVTISTIVAGTPTVLLDGYITGRQLAPGWGPGGTSVSVSGEDVSVKMNMIEISFDYPHMGDFLIVEAILAKYLLFKILPDAKPTLADAVPFGYVPQQSATDRSYLQQLAQKHGYRFYVSPGPGKGWNTAYWGPPDYSSPPQPALLVDMGPATNVVEIQFGENVLAPTMTYGTVPQTTIPPPMLQSLPVIAFASTRSPALAKDPVMGSYGGELGELLTSPLSALKNLLELDVRGSLFQTSNLGPTQDQSLGVLQAEVTAQGLTNDSTDEVVTAKGRLDTSRYGNVLQSPGIVVVRGAGWSCDGKYYVKEVKHAIDLRPASFGYTQEFTLTREGMGSTVRYDT